MNRFKRVFSISFTLALVLIMITACGQSPQSSENKIFTMVGSSTIQPLAEKLAEGYMAENSSVRVDVQGGGSSVGVKAAGGQTADIGMASRDVKESEFSEFPNIVVTVIARDGIAIIANENVGVSDLSLEQIQKIFSGQIKNWSELGGADAHIIVVSREEGSGTRTAFEEMVLGEDLLMTETAILQPSNGSVRTTVSTTPDAIGYLSFGYLDESVKAISVDGVAPTEANASNGTYPVVRPLNIITYGEPSGDLKLFIDYILSDSGQTIVGDEGYIAVN
ncbi:MAG TPA: phosphate ABC transporter substrate-binding protein [Chloroflexi bacterium]|nr:phosphate ABC transporter substrate-binding protein [Chloroflexota bacterium]